MKEKMSKNVQKFLRMLPGEGLQRGLPVSFEPNHKVKYVILVSTRL